jgi:hypothetical protein
MGLFNSEANSAIRVFFVFVFPFNLNEEKWIISCRNIKLKCIYYVYIYIRFGRECVGGGIDNYIKTE